MLVRYWWSDDGIGETCEVTMVKASEPIQCTHCDSFIEIGDEYAELKATDGSIYKLHLDCLKKSTKLLPSR